MAFYQCPKCKKVWQYPIEKCPDCFLNLERMKSEHPKVVGISKVAIPTVFHPEIPYFVLVLEDKNGNRWVQKSIKEYRLGDEFKIETAKDKNAVAIWRVKYDFGEGIEKAVELLEGININQNSKILVLPTLVSPVHPFFAENTSPQFLEAAIKYLTEKGVKIENIKVAGQSFDEIPIEFSAQKSQLLTTCQKYKIIPLDLAKTNFIKKTQNNLSFEISEEVFNSDLIFNLPILKIGKASASENILKVLKKESYLGLKYLTSDEEIIEALGKILPGLFTLADAEVVQDEDKFTHFFGLVLASFNYLNLDRAFAEVAMLEELPELLKKVKIDNIPILGRQLKELRYRAK